MTKAENVGIITPTFTDEPLDLTEIQGIGEAIETVAETREAVIVECEDRFSDYRVRWNDKTESVRIEAIVPGAVYEPPKRLYEDGHPENLVAGDPA